MNAHKDELDLWEAVAVDIAQTTEATLAEVLKPRGFRKRARNWFRATTADEYQVVNLQKSSWGGGNCYLNLGWHPSTPAGEFRPENRCAVSLRAEQTDVIRPIEWLRPDGLTVTELPGIALLDTETSRRMSLEVFAVQVLETVAIPVADLLDRTPSVVDLVPLLTAKPWYATRSLRDHFGRLGIELPTSGHRRERWQLRARAAAHYVACESVSLLVGVG